MEQKRVTNIKRLEDIQAKLATLDPAKVAAEVDRMISGRVIAWQPKEAPARSSEHGLPTSDPIDRWYAMKHKRFLRELATVERGLNKALATQSEILLGRNVIAAMHDGTGAHGISGAPTEAARELAEGTVAPNAASCVNCGRVVEGVRSDRIVSGRCRDCYDHRRRTGDERPRELWEQAMSGAA